MGCISQLKRKHQHCSPDEHVRILAKQGMDRIITADVVVVRLQQTGSDAHATGHMG
jgi:hypothetical protein